MSRLALCLLACLAGSPALPQTVTLRCSTVLDGKGATLHDTNLVIMNGRIARIGGEPQGRVIDLRGMTVMPGWIDTHVHVTWHFGPDNRLSYGASGSQAANQSSNAASQSSNKETREQATLYAAGNLWATLRGGFTTIQSLGAIQDKDLRDMIESRQIPGPRLLSSLRQLNENSGDPEKLRQLVEQQVKEGADVVKVFASKSIRDGGGQSMSNEQLKAICYAAKAAGKRVVVHAHASDAARAAVLAGATSIEHGTFLDDATLRLMKDRGVYFDPNLLVLHNYIDKKPQFLGIGNYNEEGFGWMEQALPKVADVIQRARKIGVQIIYGTDAVAGAHGRNAEEFIYRVKDGREKPMDVLISATSLAAKSLRLDGSIGSITKDLQADIVATDGNPMDDITAVRRVVFVMKGGEVVRN